MTLVLTSSRTGSNTNEESRRSSNSEDTPLLKNQNSKPNASMMVFTWCSCRKRLANRKVLVDVLAILFGTASWVAVNGMFVQLPLLVQTQPEGWNLPSYLSVIVQIANIGPILYTISQKVLPGKIKDSRIIYTILIMGSLALLLMAFLYKNTTLIFGELHSTSLFILQFFISLVGCTSSVLFMPFMSNFKEIYLISYFIGEGLSGFLPSIIALAQGVGGNPSCVNRTILNVETNVTSVYLEQYTPPPHFTSQVFFLVLFATMTSSTIAFFLLNNLDSCKSEKVYPLNTKQSRKKYSSNNGSHRSIATIRNSITYGMDAIPPLNVGVHTSGGDTSFEANTTLKEEGEGDSGVDSMSHSSPSSYLTRITYFFLLALASWVCVFGNGVFPSIQSYSCLPYGNTAYHLSATLSSMANPVACFVAFFIPYNSVKAISLLTALSTAISAYIAATALIRPSPLVNSIAGEILVVLSWTIFTALISFIKVSIASLLRREPGRALFWCGAVQQMGSAVGAIVAFFLVNYANIFHSYNPCQ